MTKKNCCKNNNKDAAKKGILFGLLAHLPCIALIIITIIGISLGGTLLTTFMSSYLFYGLIGLSFVLVTISAIIYLKRQNSLNIEGIKDNWKYLAILYGIAIIINILFLTVIFPYSTNLVSASQNKITFAENLQIINLQVNIPCAGHAILISSELKKDLGIKNVEYNFPSSFKISFNPKETTKQNILNNPIFKEYSAKEI